MDRVVAAGGQFDLLDLWTRRREDLREAILDNSACSRSVAHAAVFMLPTDL